MSDQHTPRRQMIPANFSDSDAAMAKWIVAGFVVLVGGLIAVMAVPGILQALRP